MTDTDQGPIDASWRRPHDLYPAIDARPYVSLLDERFGIAPETFEPFHIFKPNRDSLWIVNRDLELPFCESSQTLGMPFFYPKMDYPRPATPTAIHFGQLATRHLVDLTPIEIGQILRRHKVDLDAERAGRLDGNGYVLLRDRGLVFGLGYYRPEGPGGTLRGMLPRSWTSRLTVEPPPDEPLPWVTSSET